MSTYVAPIDSMMFTLEEVAGLGEVASLPGNEEVSADLVRAVLEEAGKVAEELLAPVNKSGDQEGSNLVDGRVTCPTGWQEAYDTLAEGGWFGLPFGEEWGGMGLPWLVNAAVQEMIQGANMAFGVGTLVSMGAVEALDAYGSDEQKQAYLPNMVSGAWSGTMNLTEAGAGSDLASIRTKAIPDGDHYKVIGQKIFITYGDHELTENIIHLVLARTPDAPAGVKGISLFIVPKFLEDGSRNDVHCVSLEHKLGIHGSPTAVLSFGDKGGAIGYLVGEENQGLKYMFAMMNRARLSVGLQGVGVAEHAYQQAVAYSRERVQGVALGQSEKGPIIRHPNIRRKLMTMKSRIEAMRGVAYQAALAIDMVHRTEDPVAQAAHQARLDFLTPIAKGWCSEWGNEVASLGMQVFGGMGYVEETGACQHFRDVRITTIYEGTTGIQANDLVGRKIAREDGKTARLVLAEVAETVSRLRQMGGADFDSLADGLQGAADQVSGVVDWLIEKSKSDVALLGAASFNVLMMWGALLGGKALAEGAMAAKRRIADAEGDGASHQSRIDLALYYTAQEFPLVQAMAEIVKGAETVMAMEEAQF
ncbi:MAG: acyl-CoA dehydrogenase [Magnetovibrionaceae bacterium]